MSDDKTPPYPPRVALLLAIIKYVIGPSIAAAITATGLYFAAVQGQIREDIRDELQKRDDAEEIVVRIVSSVATIHSAESIAPLRTDIPVLDPIPVAPVRSITLAEPLPVIRGVPVEPAKLDKLADVLQPQEQGDELNAPPEVIREWGKLRRDPPDIQQIRAAVERVQRQAQAQTDRY